MTNRLWFYLDEALTVAEHAAAATTFDTRQDGVEGPALILAGGNGICLHSNGRGATAQRVSAAYAQGAPAGTGRELVRGGLTAGQEVTVHLPLRPHDHDGLLRDLRQAATDGHQWLVVALDDGITLYPRRTLEAVTNDNARWVPAQVRIFGVLGPYESQVADGYRWYGFMIPRFTATVVDAITADLTALAATNPQGHLDIARRDGDTVEITTPAGAHHVTHADAEGRFTLGAYAWCWETTEGDPHGPRPAIGGHAATTRQVSCLCPQHCLLCGQPAGSHHDAECTWPTGSREGERPHLRPEPRVLTGHVHRPGCRHAQPHPGGLFQQVTDEGDVRCTICGAINTIDGHQLPSFGGTTEYHYQCAACNAQWGFCDLSAVR